LYNRRIKANQTDFRGCRAAFLIFKSTELYARIDSSARNELRKSYSVSTAFTSSLKEGIHSRSLQHANHHRNKQ